MYYFDSTPFDIFLQQSFFQKLYNETEPIDEKIVETDLLKNKNELIDLIKNNPDEAEIIQKITEIINYVDKE